MRTEAEMLKQFEARYIELKNEAQRKSADPDSKYPCKTCKWRSSRDDDGIGPYVCIEPLVKGYTPKRACYQVAGVYGDWNGFCKVPPLCGPEKALWHKKEIKYLNPTGYVVAFITLVIVVLIAISSISFI